MKKLILLLAFVGINANSGLLDDLKGNWNHLKASLPDTTPLDSIKASLPHGRDKQFDQLYSSIQHALRGGGPSR